MGQISSLFSPMGSCNKPTVKRHKRTASAVSLYVLSFLLAFYLTPPPPHPPHCWALSLSLCLFCGHFDLFGIFKIFSDMRRFRASQPLMCINHVGKMPWFFFFFLLGHASILAGSQFLWPEIECGSWQWKPGILTTRPLGNSQDALT